jgi:hypothetical protein
MVEDRSGPPKKRYKSKYVPFSVGPQPIPPSLPNSAQEASPSADAPSADTDDVRDSDLLDELLRDPANNNNSSTSQRAKTKAKKVSASVTVSYIVSAYINADIVAESLSRLAPTSTTIRRAVGHSHGDIC